MVIRDRCEPPASIVGEIEFGDGSVRVDIYASEEWVEIYVEADSEMLPEERRRFALLNTDEDSWHVAPLRRS
jgi:hypothetical protein